MRKAIATLAVITVMTLVSTALQANFTMFDMAKDSMYIVRGEYTGLERTQKGDRLTLRCDVIIKGDLVVGPAHAERGAGPADPQGVVRATDVQRLAGAAVDVGGGAEGPVVDGVGHLDLHAGTVVLGAAAGHRQGRHGEDRQHDGGVLAHRRLFYPTRPGGGGTRVLCRTLGGQTP